MSLLPISTSRVSDPLRNFRTLSQLHTDQAALQRAFDQLSTGRRVVRISDDPVAAGRAIALKRSVSRGEQLGRNASITQGFYAATEAALGNLGGALIEARGVAVQASQNTLSPEDREALALTVEQAAQTAVRSGNAVFREHSLLGGHLTSGPPLRQGDLDVLFVGNEAVGQAHLGGADPQAIGISGTTALGLAGALNEPRSLRPALQLDTPLADVAAGRGAKAGVMRLSDGDGWTEVDLQHAQSIRDVAEAIGAVTLSGRPLDVNVLPDGLEIDFADGLGGTLVIDDLPNHSLAADLGIRHVDAMSPSPIVSDSLPPRLTARTTLSSLQAGAGIDVSAGIRIRQADQVINVDLAGAETVGDLLVAINRSAADVRAEISADAQAIVIRAMREGVDYSVGENGGDVAGALGIRTARLDTPLSQLNSGLGLSLNDNGPELVIHRTDGQPLAIDLDGAETIQDVLDRINNHQDNQDAPAVLAALNAVGNGITLQADAADGPLRVQVGESSNAAVALGLVPAGQDEAIAQQADGQWQLLGSDYAPQSSGGTIDTLLRLAEAIREEDLGQIARLTDQLDIHRERTTKLQGRVGTWMQNLDRLRHATDDEVLALEAQLSEEIDADLATVISEISSRQAAQEASLRLLAQSVRTTLLDFL